MLARAEVFMVAVVIVSPLPTPFQHFIACCGWGWKFLVQA
jgi:hypothetical protein